MSTELDWAYEVLGVKPGVSDRELKAAHRDLAKVWHPDRFVHDPHLQEKAQDKLKEINEAYEQLISRHKRKATSPRPRATRHQASPEPVRVAAKRGVGWYWWIAAFAVFAVVFAFTTKTLVRKPEPQPDESAQVEEPIQQAPTTTTRPDANHTVRNRDDNNLAPAPQPATESVPATNEAIPAVATVTVSIDPKSGLLATASCPVKSRMTYPSGSEPHTYCNIDHITKPEKKPGIKNLAKRISDID